MSPAHLSPIYLSGDHRPDQHIRAADPGPCCRKEVESNNFPFKLNWGGRIKRVSCTFSSMRLPYKWSPQCLNHLGSFLMLFLSLKNACWV